MRERAASSVTLPTSFAIVILPPIRAELGRNQKDRMHQYSDLFDLERQARLFLRRQNCYVTGMMTFERFKDEGLVTVAEDIVFEKLPMQRGPWLGKYQHWMYRGMEMSFELRER